MSKASLPKVPRSRFFHAVIFALTIVIVSPTTAQNPITNAVDRAQLLRNEQPTLRDSSDEDSAGETEEIAASPNDPDLGRQAILKRSDRYQAWTFYTAAPFSYTTNVALSRTNEQGDFLFTPSVGISYAPKLARNLFGNISVGQQFFYYDEFDDLDFGSFDLRAGLNYSLPQLHNLILRAEYAFNRLTSEDGFDDEFYSSHSVNLGAEIPFRIGRAQQVSIGADLSFSLAACPDDPRRHDFSTFAAYTVGLSRAFAVSAVVRLALRDYVETDRTDFSAIFGLSANYRITRWLSASANANFTTNDSNRRVFDYDVGNFGGALALQFRL